VIQHIREIHGSCDVAFDEWRPSDQRYYVSDTRKFNAATGWEPRTNIARGIERLYDWAAQQRKTPRKNAQRWQEPEHSSARS
jgi:CDP-paratose 2-epimerase